MYRTLSALLILFFGLSLAAYANQNPRSLATDHRIKIVGYNSDDIVTVHGCHFISTAIYLGKDEVIQNVNMGDQLAWDVTVTKEAPNVLFVKPKLPESDTNLTVLTNKRSYQFRLFTQTGDTPRSKSVMYALQFNYPEEEKQALQHSLTSLQQMVAGNSPSDAVNWNYDYSFYGSKRIAPIQAVDNGTFTIFKFPKQTKIPAIFAVDDHQNESIVNVRVQGDYVFIQGINHQYTLRNGDDVTTVYNDSYRINS